MFEIRTSCNAGPGHSHTSDRPCGANGRACAVRARAARRDNCAQRDADPVRAPEAQVHQPDTPDSGPIQRGEAPTMGEGQVRRDAERGRVGGAERHEP